MSRVKHTHQGKGVAQLEIDKLKKQIIQLTDDNKSLVEQITDAVNTIEQMKLDAGKLNS